MIEYLFVYLNQYHYHCFKLNNHTDREEGGGGRQRGGRKPEEREGGRGMTARVRKGSGALSSQDPPLKKGLSGE